MGLPAVGLAKALERLLLALMIAVDGEGHELVERHAVLGIGFEELGRDRGQPEALSKSIETRSTSPGDLASPTEATPSHLRKSSRGKCVSASQPVSVTSTVSEVDTVCSPGIR